MTPERLEEIRILLNEYPILNSVVRMYRNIGLELLTEIERLGRENEILWDQNPFNNMEDEKEV